MPDPISPDDKPISEMEALVIAVAQQKKAIETMQATLADLTGAVPQVIGRVAALDERVMKLEGKPVPPVVP